MRGMAAILFVAVVFLCLGLFEPAYADRARSTPHVDVVGNDYAFNPLPKRIKQGTTIFTFANRGKVPHELAMGAVRFSLGLYTTEAEIERAAVIIGEQVSRMRR